MSCADCNSGYAHEGEPKGRVTEVHGEKHTSQNRTKDYLSKASFPIIPDGLGFPFINNKLLADDYASKGQFKVYLPDFQDGWSVPVWTIDTMRSLQATDTLSAWVWKPYHFFFLIYGIAPFAVINRFGPSMIKVTAFFDAVRNDEGKDIAIGAAGFCWGGKHAVNLADGMLAANGKPLVDVAFTGHLSTLDIPNEMGRVKKPVSIAVGDKDVMLPMAQVEQISTMFKDLATDCEIKGYPEAGHGFCCRDEARPTDEVLIRQSLEAENPAISWFQKHFAAAG